MAIYMLSFLIVYLLFVFILPSYRTKKQTGINPVTFGNSDSVHDYAGKCMKVLIALLFITPLSGIISAEFYNCLSPLPCLDNRYMRISGLIFIHAALLWTIVAQVQMNRNWRIGIDEINTGELIKHGLFSICRNPVFLGMIVTVCGNFMVMPNLLTFFVMGASYMLIQIQIRLEEEFLLRRYGEEYKQYCSKTKRLI